MARAEPTLVAKGRRQVTWSGDRQAGEVQPRVPPQIARAQLSCRSLPRLTPIGLPAEAAAAHCGTPNNTPPNQAFHTCNTVVVPR